MRTLLKQPAEKRKFSFDFRNAMAEDATIAGVTSLVGDPAGLTISGVSYSGQRVEAFFEGGNDGTTYKVTCTVTDSVGQSIELDGNLQVKAL